jgi:hypothetical protein
MDEFCEIIELGCRAIASIGTVLALARAAHIHVRSLERKCQAVGVAARDAVAFVACAQVVLGSRPSEWSIAGNHFPDRDPRTAQKLIHKGGLDCATCPSFTDFVRNQTFIESPLLQEQLIIRMCSRGDGIAS